MSALAARLRVLPRAHTQTLRVPVRSFHSPFVVLSASNRFTAPPLSSASPVYEKQDDSSSEPHLSSSGTRTYVVSEPDPSNTPYQVPSGAYPASAPYTGFNPTAATNPKTLYSSTGSSISHQYATRNEASVGTSAAARSTESSGKMGKTGGSSH